MFASNNLAELNLKECLNFIHVLNATFDNYVFLWDIDEKKIYFGKPFSKYYAVHEDVGEAVAQPDILKLIYESDREAVKQNADLLALGKFSKYELTFRIVNRDGQIVWLNSSGTLTSIDKGQKRVVLGRISDSYHDINIDNLTGVANSVKWSEKLADSKTVVEDGYLFVCDVDNMAAINAQSGRSFGDKVLQRLAIAFEKFIGSWRNIYRLSADRFAIILSGYKHENVNEFFVYLQKELSDYCTISAGAVKLSKNEISSLANAAQYAEMALIDAQTQGRNNLQFFSQERYDRYLALIQLKSELRSSVINGCENFFICYQPLINGNNFELLGAEALLRYKSPSRGFIQPDEFISLLEETGMIRPVGKWVLRKSLEQCMQWRKDIPNFYVSVNVSYMQLQQEGFEYEVLDVLKELGAPGEALTLEITESMQLRDFEKFNKIFNVWHEKGISIAIDDFGTGYSSLGYLKKLQFDVIKIDKCFTSDVVESPYSYRLINTVREMSSFSDIKVCLEGLETEEQLRVLNDLKLNMYQGYLFSRPLLPGNFTENLINKGVNVYEDYNELIKQFSSLESKGCLLDRNLLWNVMYDLPPYEIVNDNRENIMRDTQLGLWIIRINFKKQRYEMFMDKNCAEIMGASKSMSPEEAYKHWFEHIKLECVDYVVKEVKETEESGNIVQLEYDWQHPVAGIVRVRCVGVRALLTEEQFIFKGYHRVISNIIQTSHSHKKMVDLDE